MPGYSTVGPFHSLSLSASPVGLLSLPFVLCLISPPLTLTSNETLTLYS